MQNYIHSGKSYKRVTKARWTRFSTLSTGFSTIGYVNCGQKEYANLVYIKSVKKFFSGIFHENIWDTQRGGKPWGAEDGPFWRMKQKRSISRKNLCSFSQRNSRKMPVSRLPTAPLCAIIETVEKPRRGQKSETGGDAYVLRAADE